jgi:hypothetical protein
MGSSLILADLSIRIIWRHGIPMDSNNMHEHLCTWSALTKITSLGLLELSTTLIIVLSSISVVVCTSQCSLAASNSSWNLLKTSCVKTAPPCLSNSHDVKSFGLVCIEVLSSINSSCLWHFNAVSNLIQNSTSASLRPIKRLKNELALSDLEVVRSIPPSHISLKYAGVITR